MEANQSSEFTDKIDYSKFIKGRVVQGATQLTISEADILNLNEIKENDDFLSDFLKDLILVKTQPSSKEICHIPVICLNSIKQHMKLK